MHKSENVFHCRNCDREIYPCFDNGKRSWVHILSASNPTGCEAKPTADPFPLA